MTVVEQPCQLRAADLTLDGCWTLPQQPVAQLVLAHGAGAGYRHHNMQSLAEAFARQGIVTLRFNFPFVQLGKRRADTPAVAIEAITAAVDLASSQHDWPLLLGGHSFGGRMSTHAALQLPQVRALVLTSFPLHPSKQPGIKRAAHLPDVAQPMLFASGTRDDLAQADLLQQVIDDLPRAQLHWLDTANHSYVVLKRQRQNPLDVFDEIAQTAREFLETL